MEAARSLRLGRRLRPGLDLGHGPCHGLQWGTRSRPRCHHFRCTDSRSRRTRQTHHLPSRLHQAHVPLVHAVLLPRIFQIGFASPPFY